MHHLTQISPSAGVGGGERQLLLLARYLHGTDFQFSFILGEEGSFCDELERAGLTYRVVPMPTKFRIGAWRGIGEILKHHRVDLVHCHGARANWYGRIGARRAGIRTILCTVHNSLKDYPYPAWRRRLYVNLERLTSKWVSLWIAVSEAIRKDLIDYYGLPAEKIEVVPNGIDVQDLHVRRSREEVRRDLGVEPKTLVLLEAARMTNQKGHRFLLEAVSNLRTSVPKLRCWLAGDGPLRPRLEKQVKRLNIEQYVDFLGFRSDVADLLNAADIYVLPSLSEGMPFGVLEAMSLGCPVVASSVNGVPEVIQEGITGRLVPPGDVQALSRVLGQLARNLTMRQQLAAAGRKTVQEHFTAERMAHRVGALYRSCLLRRDP
ncbi:glycosyltransferase [Acidobacteria bacterium AH-259-O06]|nr:glycosyltransferase [Acidobacteria bacterium AH-259-O06]